jgi:hypothetical protein
MESKNGNQLWLAMYNRGFEAWTAWRTYDMFSTYLLYLTTCSYKIYYPISEQNLNQTTAASTAQVVTEQTTNFSGIKLRNYC